MVTFSVSTLGRTVPSFPACAEVVGDYMVVVGRPGISGVLHGGTYVIRHLPTNTVRAFDGLNNAVRSWYSSTVLDGIVWVMSGTSGSSIRGINPVDGSLITGPNSSSGFGVVAGGRIWYGSTRLTGWSPSDNTTVLTPSNVHSGNTATAFGSNRLYTYRLTDGLIREIDTDTGNVVATYPSPGVPDGRGVVIGDHIWWLSDRTSLIRFHVPTGEAVKLPITPDGLPLLGFGRPRLGADGTIWVIELITDPTWVAQITVINTSTLEFVQGDVPLIHGSQITWAMYNGTPIIACGEPVFEPTS